MNYPYLNCESIESKQIRIHQHPSPTIPESSIKSIAIATLPDCRWHAMRTTQSTIGHYHKFYLCISIIEVGAIHDMDMPQLSRYEEVDLISSKISRIHYVRQSKSNNNRHLLSTLEHGIHH
jgi:hypothetical protein